MMENSCPIFTWGRSFFGSLATDQIFMKFGVDIIFWTGSCSIIQSCSPDGANSTRTASHIRTRANISSFYR